MTHQQIAGGQYLTICGLPLHNPLRDDPNFYRTESGGELTLLPGYTPQAISAGLYFLIRSAVYGN